MPNTPKLANLKDGFTAYRCIRCGHFVGDPKNVAEWRGDCPPERNGGCEQRTLFERVDGN